MDEEKGKTCGADEPAVEGLKPQKHRRWEARREEGRPTTLWINGPGNAGFAFSTNWTNLLLGAALGTLAFSARKSKRKGKHHENRHLRRHF